MKQNPEFDIVLWGATGFTGRLAAEKLAARIGSRGDLRWAIAGRNRAKLEAVRSQLGAGFEELPIIIGDSHDVASLEALVARTRVVCSTVGPYAMYGSELLGACARSGTDYCDLTGEAHWIRKMMDAHEAEAKESGARIVHACGMDSIPSDLGVLLLQRRAKEIHGEPCSSVKLRVTELRGGFSGGTAASLLHGTDAGRDDPSIGQHMRDPYCLAPEGHRAGPDLPESMTSVKVEYDEDLSAWTKPFFMGPMNTKIVRRTNALLGYPYGEDFRYEEATLVGDGRAGWFKAKGEAIGYVAFVKAVGIPPTRWLLKRYVLPESGEGPSREVREAGHWELVLIGKTDDGTTVRARVRGEGDPSAESTSRMLVESALCLAEDADQIPVDGGSWTPASAMADLLLARLPAHAGVSFELEPASTPPPKAPEVVEATDARSATSGIDLSSGPISSGRTADVYAAPDGQVLKLLKPGFHPLMLSIEATRTAAVHAAGVPAPRVGDHVEVDGRPGLLFESIDGPTMLEVALSDLDKMDGFVVPFTNLHVDVFNAVAGNDLPDVKDYLAEKIDRADLPLTQRTRAKDHMVGLPDGASTLHGDYHPGNILLSPDGPIVIDWGEAARGAVAADIARTLLLLTPESAADVAPDPEGIAGRVIRFANAYTKLCLQKTATTAAEVEAWRLPVVAARLDEGIAEQAGLLQAEVARLTS